MPPRSATRIAFDAPTDLAELRQAVARAGRAVDMPEARIDDLRLAISELATNSLQHGGGEGQLAIWQMDQQLVCEIRDAGRMKDPAQVVSPEPLAEQGRGLWIVDQACDEVRRESGREGTITQVIIYGQGA